MEPLNITLGGGPIEATPGSPLVCDSCGCADELKEWETSTRANAKVYRYCKVCWFDIEDSYDEIQQTAMREEECDYCGLQTTLTCDYTHRDGHTIHLCENCYQCADDSEDFMEPLPKRQELPCEDCAEKPATKTFHHLDGRTFDLCEYCFQLADHEDDYGADFGSTPNLRTSGQATLCECPLPCDFVSPTRCELCKGIVVSLKDD